VAGGIDVPLYLGSRSTFPNGNFGGYQGRCEQQQQARTHARTHMHASLPVRADGFAHCLSVLYAIRKLPAVALLYLMGLHASYNTNH
jgi:hypothetical protein